MNDTPTVSPSCGAEPYYSCRSTKHKANSQCTTTQTPSENRWFLNCIPQLCQFSDQTVWSFITVFWFTILWLDPYLDLPWVKSRFQRKMLPINGHNQVAERILWQGASMVLKRRRVKSFQLSTRIHWTLLLEGMTVIGNGVIYAKENKGFSEGSGVHRHAFKQRGLTGKSVIYIGNIIPT